MNIIYSLVDGSLLNTVSNLSSEVPLDKSRSINMLTQPIFGQRDLDDLYTREQVSSMPNKFISSICSYSHPSLSYPQIKNLPEFGKIYEQLISQWRILSVNHGGQNHSLSGANSNCCCSHPIENLYFIKNLFNDNILLIGSDCIRKFAKDTNLDQDLTILNKLLYTCDHCRSKCLIADIIGKCCPNCIDFKTSDKRPCMVCLNIKNLKDGYNRCKACWTKKDNNYINIDIIEKHSLEILTDLKDCAQCEHKFYAEEDWKTYCRKCYVERRKADQSTSNNNQEPNKICNKCGSHFYATEEWKTTCLSCYRSGTKECEICSKTFFPKVKMATKCYPCYTNTK